MSYSLAQPRYSIAHFSSTPLLLTNDPLTPLEIHRERNLIQQSIKDAGKKVEIIFSHTTKTTVSTLLDHGCVLLHLSGHGNKYTKVSLQYQNSIKIQKKLKFLQYIKAAVDGNIVHYRFVPNSNIDDQLREIEKQMGKGTELKPRSEDYSLVWENSQDPHIADEIFVRDIERILDKITGPKPRVIFLSSCYSAGVVEAFRKYHPKAYIIAINEAHPVLDESARSFIPIFYGDLLNGRDVIKAFERAKPTITLQSEQDKFKLFSPSDSSASTSINDLCIPFPLLPEIEDVMIKPITPYFIPNNLPPPPEIYFFEGRTKDMYEVIDKLLSLRVVTIHGPGGIGKTDLAKAVGGFLSQRGGGDYISFNAILFIDTKQIKDDLTKSFIDLCNDALKSEYINFPAIEDVKEFGRKRYLVVIDQAEVSLTIPYEDDSFRSIYQFLNELKRSGAYALVTSLDPLCVEKGGVKFGEDYELKKISEESTNELLKKYKPYYVAPDKLIEELHGNPSLIYSTTGMIPDEKSPPVDPLKLIENVRELNNKLNNQDNLMRLSYISNREDLRKSRMARVGEFEKYAKPLSYQSNIKSKLSQNYCSSTRGYVIDQFREWTKSDPASPLFWILGGPGSGKSFISALLYSKFKKNIAAVQWCEHQFNHSVSSMIYSLVWYLANHFQPYKDELIRGNYQFDISDPALLFNQIVTEPLGQISASSFFDSEEKTEGKKILWLIDALDESENSGNNKLLVILDTELKKLPKWFGVVITSRPETYIVDKLKKFSPFVINLKSAENVNDLKNYLEFRLNNLLTDPVRNLKKATSIMMDKADGLFLYASKVLEDEEKNMDHRLTIEDVERFPSDFNDFLFRTMEKERLKLLAQKFEWKNVLRIVQVIFASLEPISCQMVGELLNLSERLVLNIMQSLSTIFSLSQTRTIKVFHKSIQDWMTNEDRKTGLRDESDYFINVYEGHSLWFNYSTYLLGYSDQTLFLENFDRIKKASQNKDSLINYAIRFVSQHARKMEEWSKLFDLFTNLTYTELRISIGEGYSLIREIGEMRDVMVSTSMKFEDREKYLKQLKQYHRFLVWYMSHISDNGESLYYYALSWSDDMISTQAEQIKGWWSTRLKHYVIWKNKCKGNSLTLSVLRHTGCVTSVCISDDGKRIISGSDDETVRVWDAESGQLNSTLEGHTGDVSPVCMSRDGKKIISGSHDNTVRVWDAESGQLNSTLEGHTDSVTSMCISKDGKKIISGSWDKTVRVWDAKSGQLNSTLKGHTGWVNSVCISKDGKKIISGGDDKTVRVWDAESGQLHSTLEGHTGWVNSMCISKDGKKIISGSDDKTVRVWDAESGQLSSTLEGHTGSVTSVCISDDGKKIISGSYDNTVRVWDAGSGQLNSTLEGHTGRVTSVCMSKNGKKIISGSLDKTVRVWDAESGQLNSTLEGHTGRVTSVCISKDGKKIISGSSDKTVRVWDSESGQLISTLEGHTGSVTSVCISDDGKKIISGSDDTTVRVWDAESGQLISTLEGHTGSVMSVCMSKDGKKIISGSDDKSFRVWDAESGQLISTLEGHTGSVTSVCISDDGKKIISGSSDKTVRVWDAESGQLNSTLEGHSGCVNSVCISDDGKKIISGSSDKTVRVWDAESGQLNSTSEGHSGCVNSVCISDDGRKIISGSSDKTVRVWDAESGQLNSTLEGHTNTVESVCISNDGKKIISGSDDKTVRVWDVEIGQLNSTLEGHTNTVESVCISKDGKKIISGSYDNTVRVCNVEAELGRMDVSSNVDDLIQSWTNSKCLNVQFSFICESRSNTGFLILSCYSLDSKQTIDYATDYVNEDDDHVNADKDERKEIYVSEEGESQKKKRRIDEKKEVIK